MVLPGRVFVATAGSRSVTPKLRGYHKANKKIKCIKKNRDKYRFDFCSPKNTKYLK